MTLTSNQYKQLLFQMLRRMFSRRTSDGASSNALIYKVGSLLNDPSVVVKQSNYEELKEFFDRQTQYCYDNKIYRVYDYYQDSNFDSNFAEWQELMANLGIGISINSDDDLVVVMPDGTETIIDYSYFTPWYINSRQGTSYSLASLSDTYKYKYDVDDLPDLSDDDYKVISTRCKWSYNEDTDTVVLYGKGKLCSRLAEYFIDVLGLCPGTFIINADIIVFDELINRAGWDLVIVYFGGEDQEIVMPSGEDFIYGGYSSTVANVTIYTDNKIMKNITYPSDSLTNVVIKSLSEWEG